MQIREPYKPRAIRFLDLWSPPSAPRWRLKVYGIAYAGVSPPEPLVIAAKRLASAGLASAGGSHYAVGYLGIHAGRDSDFVFLGWWSNENELHHHAYLGPSGNPARLVPASSSDPIACVWDLALVGFERQAWIDAVLDNPHGALDLDEYDRRTLDADL